MCTCSCAETALRRFSDRTLADPRGGGVGRGQFLGEVPVGAGASPWPLWTGHTYTYTLPATKGTPRRFVLARHLHPDALVVVLPNPTGPGSITAAAAVRYSRDSAHWLNGNRNLHGTRADGAHYGPGGFLSCDGLIRW